jgi:hypothetical protein
MDLEIFKFTNYRIFKFEGAFLREKLHNSEIQ